LFSNKFCHHKKEERRKKGRERRKEGRKEREKERKEGRKKERVSPFTDTFLGAVWAVFLQESVVLKLSDLPWYL
jgi:hypothetical protein